MTEDHTLLADKLFATNPSGSAEYAGLALNLAQSTFINDPEAAQFKAIVIAGNETIYQGPMDPLTAATDSLSKDIIVNSIFCGEATFPNSSTPFKKFFLMLHSPWPTISLMRLSFSRWHQLELLSKKKT